VSFLRPRTITEADISVCNIPVDSPRVPDASNRPSPAWLRPVHKRYTPSPGTTRDNSVSPAASTSTGYAAGANPKASIPSSSFGPHGDLPYTNAPGHIGNSGGVSRPTHQTALSLGLADGTDLDAMFNTDKYFNSMSPPNGTFDLGAMDNVDYMNGTLGSFAGAAAGPGAGHGIVGLDQGGSYNDFSINIRGNGLAADFGPGSGMLGADGLGMSSGGYDQPGQDDHDQPMLGVGVGVGIGVGAGGGSGSSSSGAGLNFDFGGSNGFGGEMLAGEGMDSVSDGLKGAENQGL
jgi:hypothetical protein